MTVAEGLEVQVVAAEPLVRQPVAIDFDDSGRLWVIQYLQYPNPAGLNRVSYDRYSRTVYDRVPEPPPHGPRGADRITVLTDEDGDGRYDSGRDFIDGLNLATGMAFGRGGVYVLQTPYLLFYPDRNGDDVPDSDPQVLLKGFGMEDAHSVANSLTWGPDGWLYGAQGSTVTANIRGIEFQQGVWRYHPVTDEFELFYEGGGNTWGLDFDAAGQMFASTNVGGYCFLHGVQGGYYWKSFGKHGALHNPYTFGYFDHVEHRDLKGGHVTVGGVIYKGDLLPDRFRGRYIAANLLSHTVYSHELTRHGSTYQARQVEDVLLANDTWFAPSDVTVGPDGALYVADWHDARTAHPDPDAEWDRTNGRIVRIAPRGSRANAQIDLNTLSPPQLIEALSSTNHWLVRRARRRLIESGDGNLVGPLMKLFTETEDAQLALEYLWVLHGIGAFDDQLATKALAHENENVRNWAARLLGDRRSVSPPMADALAELAASEPQSRVRSQLASTARRLPAEQGLPIVDALLSHEADRTDTHLPLLLWWAVEQHCESDRAAVLDRFGTRSAWRRPFVREAILGRLIRRYAAMADDDGFAACVRFFDAACARPVDATAMEADLRLWLESCEAGLPEVSFDRVPEELRVRFASFLHPTTDDVTVISLLARVGDWAARDRARELALDNEVDTSKRVAMLDVLSRSPDASLGAPLLSLVTNETPQDVQRAALRCLVRFTEPDIARQILKRYSNMNDAVRVTARDVLFGRPGWARLFLAAVEEGRVAAADVPVSQVTILALHKDDEINEKVRQLWGRVESASPGERLAEVRRLNNDVRAGPGDAVAGRTLYMEHCGKCHKLFGEGNEIGPDLTTANRQDREFLLKSIVDPAAVVRKEYLNYTIQTSDGRVLTGLIAEQSPTTVTLLDANNQRIRILRDEIDELAPATTSLMPERLYEKLKPSELRDLFAYLQATEPPEE